MNVPNFLSILRLIITIFFIIAVHHDRFIIALLLFLLQAVTDLLDGFIARVWSKKTDLGAFLDPIADKTMLVAAFVMLTIKDIVPLWLTILVILKDVVVAGGFLFLYRLARTAKPLPTIFGKIATTFQIITIPCVLWPVTSPLSVYCFFVTAFFTALAGLHYIYVGIHLLRNNITNPPA